MIIALAATALAALFLAMWFRAEIQLSEWEAENQKLREEIADERRRRFKVMPPPTDHRRSVA